MNLNSGTPWIEVDTRDPRAASVRGRNVEEIAGHMYLISKRLALWVNRPPLQVR
jgi:hypothetical protein